MPPPAPPGYAESAGPDRCSRYGIDRPLTDPPGAGVPACPAPGGCGREPHRDRADEPASQWPFDKQRLPTTLPLQSSSSVRSTCPRPAGQRSMVTFGRAALFGAPSTVDGPDSARPAEVNGERTPDADRQEPGRYLVLRQRITDQP